MIPRVKRLVALVLVVAALVYLHMVRVTYPSSTQLQYDRNVGELVGDREVGQLFESIRPNLTAVAFQVATYSGRENTRDVTFELRERVADREPLRRVVVNAREFGDHQLARFTFTPIRDSRGKTYYASVRSPASVAGNAITVDYHSGNPYQKGPHSAMVVLPRARENLPSFDGTLKTGSDTAFAVYHRISLWEYLRLMATEKARQFVHVLRTSPRDAYRTGLFGLTAVMLAVLAFARQEHQGRTLAGVPRSDLGRGVLPALVGFLVLLGLLLRLQYVHHLPYTNDEGTYLYDARTVLQWHLPGGDALAKAPVVIGAFAAGIAVLGNTLTASRMVSMLAGLLTTIPLFVIGRWLGGKRMGIVAVVLWLLGSAPALLTAYGHTQPVQMFFATSGLALLVWALTKNSARALLVAGLLLGVGVAARKSTLALGLPALLVLLQSGGGWRPLVRRALLVGAGCVLAVVVFLAFVHALYGSAGVWYATGLGLAKESLTQLQDRGDLYATYSVKGVLPFFRESLPFIFLALVGLGQGLGRFLRRFGIVPAALAWLLPLFLAWQGGIFLQRFEEERHFAYGLWPFWVAMEVALLALGILALWRRSDSVAVGDDRRPRVLVPAVWFLATAVFYAFWIKFHANYLLEFLPALTLLAAGGAQWLTDLLSPHRLARLAAVVLVTWGAYSAAHSGYHFEHTGTFHWSSVSEAAEYLRTHVPLNESVLTGAVIVPYLSGHHVPFDVGHPTWYGYGFIEPELRNIFMAPAERMVDTVVHDVNWVVLERLTEFSYLREYPAIAEALAKQFTTVQEIENPSNTIGILRRQSCPAC